MSKIISNLFGVIIGMSTASILRNITTIKKIRIATNNAQILIKLALVHYAWGKALDKAKDLIRSHFPKSGFDPVLLEYYCAQQALRKELDASLDLDSHMNNGPISLSDQLADVARHIPEPGLSDYFPEKALKEIDRDLELFVI